MQSSIKLFIAAAVAAASFGLGCQSIPESDAPGGILSGNELQTQYRSKGSMPEQTAIARTDTSPPRSPATRPASSAPAANAATEAAK